MKKCAIRAEIALLLTNQIAGNAIDFKMNIINVNIPLFLGTSLTIGIDFSSVMTELFPPNLVVGLTHLFC